MESLPKRSPVADVPWSVMRAQWTRLPAASITCTENWLPHSGEELRGYPIFFHYLNLKINTPEHELITDVHLPLK